MQHAQGSDQAWGEVQPLGQANGAGQAHLFGQGLPRVFALHVVQVLALRQGMDFGEVAPGHPAQEPFLEQQGGTGLRFVGAAAGQGLQ
ncbi:hypothetical protein D3C80_1606450 [compost metagenome]